MSDATERLDRLFLDLEKWSKSSRANSLASWDSLAHISLKIIETLLDERELCRWMANTLGIIVELESLNDPEDELAQLLSNADDSLEEGLRGFSKLLDNVLKDCFIRRDPTDMLQTIAYQRKSILELFNCMQVALRAYLEINEILGLNAPRAAAAIFVHFLKQIYQELQKNLQLRADEAMFYWLDGRIRNEPLKALCSWISCEDLDISRINAGARFAKEQVVVFLCLRTAKDELVAPHEADMLDRVLFSLGMFGIRPFVEAGFLGVEHAVLNRDGLKRYP